MGRSVDLRSRCLSFGNTTSSSGGVESDVRGFARRERVWRMGSAVNGRMCSRVVMALEESSIFVRSEVERGRVMLVRLLEARERVVSEVNIAVRFLI